ncbi:uncharacterized protein LOC102616177 isoform X2 [Citrus sinensis]|uniref:uncharacterized protein LOC102616177 isoform X2 n=1 Tax=Citrus sinensis TaxID=2711 RepID=UPI0022794CB7|nr:uncharacterized protein LOC102616177 isoform X2 [Citrus sinensis]
MDTSDKKQITVASVFKFEDSPVFNYISSLSLIEQIKSIRNDRSFNSVNFTSPSSLFASPKIGYRRESRFSRCSTQFPDILKPELPLHGKENKKSKGNSEAVQLSDDCTGKLDCVTPGSSARELRICNMGSSVLFPATSVTGVTWSRVQVKDPRFRVRASLDTNVSDMSVNAPKGLFLPEPEHYRGPKLKVAIIGAGLAELDFGFLIGAPLHGIHAFLDPFGAAALQLHSCPEQVFCLQISLRLMIKQEMLLLLL